MMIRTQVYLTDKGRNDLSLIAREEGKNQSTLIREAIDYFIESKHQHQSNRDEILKAAQGLWRQHDDNIPQLKKLREEFNRFEKNEE